uniref:Protein FAR1-RELATED SEQUENCE n=1 Tax=Arundo donax TaxID=35708 RepID=A0A0A9DX98_ARUDO
MEEMWNIRAQCVLVYFKNDFCPFVHSTARSEGTNGLFKLDVGPTYSVMRFMQEFKRIAETTEKNKKNKITIQEDHRLIAFLDFSSRSKLQDS